MTNTPQSRPPVVVIMGHIDHGKSTLLDFIRRSNVAEKEAGGITQHISAYEASVPHEGSERKITFIDTPGHEAFRSMRGSGGQAADIAVLVVSAEDGVKPQTKEAIEWIQKNKLPFVTAFTKTDRPEANVETAKQSLAEAGIYVEGYGGEVPWVGVSGTTGDGVPELLETIILLADIHGIKDENPGEMLGIILESHRDPKKGITATVIIKQGVLSKGGFVAAPGSIAPVRILENFSSKAIDEAGAGTPVRIIGWESAPEVGGEMRAFEDKDAARAFAEKTPAVKEAASAGMLGDKKMVPLIVRADTAGSLNALVYEIGKFTHERVAPKIISASIGTLSENDVKTAQTNKDSILVAFHTGIDSSAKSLAERLGTPVLADEIIYKLTENLFEEIKKRAPIITAEKIIGIGQIVRTFSAAKDKQIVGGKVKEGVIRLGAQVNILRRGTAIGQGKLKELQYMKERISEAAEGREFGALIESKMEIAVGDEVQAFELEQIQ